jgi:hypothetical protein
VEGVTAAPTLKRKRFRGDKLILWFLRRFSTFRNQETALYVTHQLLLGAEAKIRQLKEGRVE